MQQKNHRSISLLLFWSYFLFICLPLWTLLTFYLNKKRLENKKNVKKRKKTWPKFLKNVKTFFTSMVLIDVGWPSRLFHLSKTVFLASAALLSCYCRWRAIVIYDTIAYDTRCCINVRSKAKWVSLIYRKQPTTKKCKNRKTKSRK